MTEAIDTHKDRLSRLRTELSTHGLDAGLLSHPPNVRYLSGFSGSSGLLLVLAEEACLITDFRYGEQAAAEVEGVAEVLLARDGLIALLAERLGDHAEIRKVGFEPRRIAVSDRRELGERCASVLWDDLPEIVERCRAVKDEEELARIETSVRIAERALQETLADLEEGVSERELSAELDCRLARLGSETPAFETIVASGARTALPHARPTERRLREGDLLLLDFGATHAGYCSDMTRMFVIGAAREWQRELHEHVLEAQESALAAIRPEVPASEVDRAARTRLDAVGLGDRFGHSVGHGIGLEVHEGPRLYRKSKEVLAVGNVVTVEPGVYLPGRGGVRLEEDVAVVETGHRRLTTTPRALREL